MQRFLTHSLLICICSLLSLLPFGKVFAAPALNGLAVHSELGKEKFIAALYAETLTTNFKQMLLSDERKRMEIKIVANSIFSRRFKRMWIEGVAINAGSAELQKHAPNLADFSNMLTFRLVKGDLLEIERSPRKDKGVIIKLNGHELGSIADATFFDLLLRTWISAVPLSSDFRATLLTGGTIDTDLLARYHAISPSTDRVAAIEAKLGKKAAEAETIANADTTVETTGEDTAEADTSVATTEGTEGTDTDTVNVIDDSGETVTGTATAAATTVTNATASATAEAASTETKPAVVPTSLPSEIIDEDIFEEEEEDFPVTASSLLAEQLYISKVTRWTQQKIKYPRIAQKRNQEGTVRLTLELARDGKLIDVSLVTGSGHKSLDKAALKAIKSASPFPVMPEDLKAESFTLDIPVIFTLRAPE